MILKHLEIIKMMTALFAVNGEHEGIVKVALVRRVCLSPFLSVKVFNVNLHRRLFKDCHWASFPVPETETAIRSTISMFSEKVLYELARFVPWFCGITTVFVAKQPFALRVIVKVRF